MSRLSALQTEGGLEDLREGEDALDMTALNLLLTVLTSVTAANSGSGVGAVSSADV